MEYLQQRRIIVTNIAGIIGGTVCIIFLIANLKNHYYLLCGFDLIGILSGFSLPIFSHFGYRQYPPIIAVFVYTACCSVSAFFYHNDAEYFLLLFMGIGVIIWDNKRVAIALAIVNALLFYLIQLVPIPSPAFAVPIYNKAVVLAIGLSLYVYFLYYFRVKTQEYLLQIENQNRQLKQLNTNNEKILSVVSHDIRSPIASVFSTLVMLKNDQLSKAEFDDVTDMLLDEVSNLQDNIAELLEWSKNQLNNLQPDKDNFHIKGVVISVLSFLQFQSQSKQVTIDTSGIQDLSLYADPNQIQIILRNLVNNAIKFSYPGTMVYVEAAPFKGMAEINVRDTGKGIDEEQIKNLFNAEKVVTTYGTDNEKGHGLGLKLSKDFALRNGGDLLVKSSLGQGTTITLMVPLL